jgi:hypothetical protein
MLTLGDCRSSTIVNIAGKCGSSFEFASLINEATRKLLRRGDWVGTVTPIQICVSKGCLVMPRYVQSVRKINTCHSKLPVGNLWYNFINARDWQGGRWGGFGGDWWRGARDCGALAAQGQACCYNDIPGDGWLVRAYARCQPDYGQVIQIFGVDNGNQPLRTDNGDGTWSDGVSIVLGSSGANPNYGSTAVYVRRIDHVVKPQTQCQVMLYAYNPTTNALFDLAVYDPGELTPTYTRYQLNFGHTPFGLNQGCCGPVNSVVALVKLRFIAAQFDSDLVIVDNLDALKYEVQSVRAQEAGDLQLAKGYETAAIAELNRDLQDNFDEDTFSASNEVFGGATLSNRCF